MSNNWPPLVDLVFQSDLGSIEDFLDEGRDLDERDPGGRTALIHAVIDGKEEIASLLLGHGAQVNFEDKKNWSALHFAAQNGDPKLVELLIEFVADVNLPDFNGNTPLQRAILSGKRNPEVIAAIVKAGADVKKKNNFGINAVSLAKDIGIDLPRSTQ